MNKTTTCLLTTVMPASTADASARRNDLPPFKHQRGLKLTIRLFNHGQLPTLCGSSLIWKVGEPKLSEAMHMFQV